jgi:uncharacterized protein YegL
MTNALEFNFGRMPNNYEQKCLCVLLLDNSGSMSGAPIDELNRGIQAFYNEISCNPTTSNRLEVCVISFSDTIEVLQEPALVHDFRMPILKTEGRTKMADGLRVAMSKVEDQKIWYKHTKQKYYRPWIIMITDGEPDSDQNMTQIGQDIRNEVTNCGFNFFALGVNNANMNILTQLSSRDMPPAQLQGTRFSEFFKWLSASMTKVVQHKEGDLIDLTKGVQSWTQGFKI